jgi:hypothetical protein
MKRKGKEKLIASDWRKMNLKEKYDLVLGDLAINMIPLKDWPKALPRIKKAMKDNALIVHRMWMRLPKRFKTWKQVINTYKKRKRLGIVESLAYPIIQLMYNDKERRVYFSQGIVPEIKKAWKKGLLPKKVYDYFHKFWHPYKMPNSPETKERTDRMFRRFFKIKAIRYAKDWFREFCPIYILEK